MRSYDPLRPPDPDEWLAFDETERIDLVRAYHRRAKIKLPNPLVHATIHVIVENQLALASEQPVHAALERLMAAGLDRHEAIHAVGTALAEHLNTIMQQGPQAVVSAEAYYERLSQLTVESWRRDFG